MVETTSTKIVIEHNPSQEQLQALNVFEWPIWSKEVCEFPWTYDDTETCYFLEGDVIVTLESGETVHVQQGDLAVFPSGLSCTWTIRQSVRKHYNFGLAT